LATLAWSMACLTQSVASWNHSVRSSGWTMAIPDHSKSRAMLNAAFWIIDCNRQLIIRYL
jgi:hypothetical protein